MYIQGEETIMQDKIFFQKVRENNRFWKLHKICRTKIERVIKIIKDKQTNRKGKEINIKGLKKSVNYKK